MDKHYITVDGVNIGRGASILLIYYQVAAWWTCKRRMNKFIIFIDIYLWHQKYGLKYV